MNNIFNPIEVDMLKEIVNISMGEANTQVAILLDAFGTMHIPSISIMNSTTFEDSVQSYILEDNNYYITNQKFIGKFTGECILVLDENSVACLQRHLHDTSKEDIQDTILEFTNMITVSIIKRLSKELDTDVQFSIPSITYSQTPEIIKLHEIPKNMQIIMMDTYLEFKEQKINTSIYILSKDNAILSLKNLLSDKIEILYAD